MGFITQRVRPFLLLVLATNVMAGPSALSFKHFPGEWERVGRTKLETKAGSLVVEGGYVASRERWPEVEFSFRGRATEGTTEVQVWAGFSFRDRESRYVFALRGGNNNDIYLARYAPEGGIKFLGFAPLDFKPAVGTWYQLRVVTLGNRIQIYLGDEKLPRINVVDGDCPWSGGGVCLGGGWLPAEFADVKVTALTDEQKAAVEVVGNDVWRASVADKEAKRQEQRAKYQPVQLAAFGPQRTELSLEGAWLFLPDYQLKGGDAPMSSDWNDQRWHVMDVPQFWTPGLSWLHGETGFGDLKGAAITKGVASSLYTRELQRCEGYTFDWRKTKAAWYRHYLDLPAEVQGRHFELTFDAIAKISEVWVNGQPVGRHTGMFGEVKCDVSGAVRPGRNVIAVHVTGEGGNSAKANKVEGVAVTVEVTSEMLRSLPHGMFQDNTAGIWQPVRLTVSSPVLVKDVFVEPRTNGADFHVELQNARANPAKLEVDYSIVSVADGAVLCAQTNVQAVEVAGNGSKSLKLATPELKPKLWSPQSPNLYRLEVRLREGKELVDSYPVTFGFRTFAVDGSRFLLNGQPYWLRGANPFPNTLRPNDAALADAFTKVAHEGNVRVTRSHIVPFTPTWLDAADRNGVAVSFEGTWPWLMLNGEPPSAELLAVWKEEFLSLMRKHRNHPSVILWTVNNEMKFHIFDKDDPEMLKRKWGILSDCVTAMRATDPTRPIVADSGYTRKESAKGYNAVVQANHFDDGDVDDSHRYYGWYNESFFHHFDGQYGKQLSTAGRPLINQELSTGYPNNDDGHPTRFYLFKHFTPQALVGDDAYENADPNIFQQRQAFMTKELAEVMRRAGRKDAAGVLHFSYFTWFKQPWSVETLKPGPTYYALKTALQPVLVSAELYGRHFYVRRTVKRRVCIANDADDGAALPATKLVWEVVAGDSVLSSGAVAVEPVGYYENRWVDVDFVMPKTLPTPRVDAQLRLRLEAGGAVVSQNAYDVVVASENWMDVGVQGEVSVFKGAGMLPLPPLRVQAGAVASFAAATNGNVLIVDAKQSLKESELDGLREFVRGGGKVLLLHPGAWLARLFPEQVKDFTAKNGEIVTMHVPESPVFDGLKPLDLAWFETGGRKVPLACNGVWQVVSGRDDVTALAWQCDIHGYLQNPAEVTKYSGSPLVDIRYGRGRVLASEMNFERTGDDPVAGRLYVNVVKELMRQIEM